MIYKIRLNIYIYIKSNDWSFIFFSLKHFKKYTYKKFSSIKNGEIYAII